MSFPPYYAPYFCSQSSLRRFDPHPAVVLKSLIDTGRGYTWQLRERVRVYPYTAHSL